MTEQSEAQRLADLLETNIWDGKCGQKERDEAAAELRRLDAMNVELVEALGQIAHLSVSHFSTPYDMALQARVIAIGALAKAKEQT